MQPSYKNILAGIACIILGVVGYHIFLSLTGDVVPPRAPSPARHTPAEPAPAPEPVPEPPAPGPGGTEAGHQAPERPGAKEAEQKTVAPGDERALSEKPVTVPLEAQRKRWLAGVIAMNKDHALDRNGRLITAEDVLLRDRDASGSPLILALTHVEYDLVKWMLDQLEKPFMSDLKALAVMMYRLAGEADGLKRYVEREILPSFHVSEEEVEDCHQQLVEYFQQYDERYVVPPAHLKEAIRQSLIRVKHVQFLQAVFERLQGAGRLQLYPPGKPSPGEGERGTKNVIFFTLDGENYVEFLSQSDLFGVNGFPPQVKKVTELLLECLSVPEAAVISDESPLMQWLSRFDEGTRPEAAELLIGALYRAEWKDSGLPDARAEDDAGGNRKLLSFFSVVSAVVNRRKTDEAYLEKVVIDPDYLEKQVLDLVGGTILPLRFWQPHFDLWTERLPVPVDREDIPLDQYSKDFHIPDDPERWRELCALFYRTYQRAPASGGHENLLISLIERRLEDSLPALKWKTLSGDSVKAGRIENADLARSAAGHGRVDPDDAVRMAKAFYGLHIDLFDVGPVYKVKLIYHHDIRELTAVREALDGGDDFDSALFRHGAFIPLGLEARSLPAALLKPEIAAVLEALHPGEISEITEVRNPAGYVVLKLIEMVETRLVPYAEIPDICIPAALLEREVNRLKTYVEPGVEVTEKSPRRRLYLLHTGDPATRNMLADKLSKLFSER